MWAACDCRRPTCGPHGIAKLFLAGMIPMTPCPMLMEAVTTLLFYLFAFEVQGRLPIFVINLLVNGFILIWKTDLW